MPRLPTEAEIPLAQPQADRMIGSYRGGIAADAAAQADAADAQATEQAGASLSRGITQAGQGVEQIGEAQDRINYATAVTNFLTQKQALDAQFETDPDYTTAPQRYSDQIKNLTQQAASTLESPVLRSEFQSSLTRIVSYSQEALLRASHAKAVDADRAFVGDSVNQTLDAAMRAPDNATRGTLFDNLSQVIDGMATKGSLTQQEATKLRQSVPQMYATKYFNTMLDANPALAVKLLAPNAAPLAAGVPTDLGVAIHAAAENNNVDADTLARTAQIESGGRPRTNPTSGAMGPFQFRPATARQYGLANPNDPVASSEAAAKLMADNQATLTQALGRPATGPELYLAHQQGAAGAIALIQHPDEPAAMVLTSVYGDAGKAKDAIVENGGKAGMTAGDFVGMWANRFNAAPGVPQSQQPQAGAQTDEQGNVIFPKTGDMRDFLPADVRGKMIYTGIERADTMARAALTDQERQRTLAIQAQTDASNAAETRAIADISGVGKNPNITAAEIALTNGPYKDLTPPARLRMIDFAKAAGNEGAHDKQTYGQGFTAALQRLYLPANDPNRLTDISTLVPQVGNGLTVSGFNQLKSQLDARSTPDGVAESEMKRQFLANAKAQITGTNEGLHLKDPKGDDLYLKFLAQALPAYTAGKKAGKTPAQLLNPDSADYIGKSIPSFKRPMSQWSADMLQDNAPASIDAVDLSSMPGIVSAYRAGKISRGDAAAALVKGGFATQPSDVPMAQ